MSLERSPSNKGGKKGVKSKNNSLLIQNSDKHYVQKNNLAKANAHFRKVFKENSGDFTKTTNQFVEPAKGKELEDYIENDRLYNKKSPTGINNDQNLVSGQFFLKNYFGNANSKSSGVLNKNSKNYQSSQNFSWLEPGKHINEGSTHLLNERAILNFEKDHIKSKDHNTYLDINQTRNHDKNLS